MLLICQIKDFYEVTTDLFVVEVTDDFDIYSSNASKIGIHLIKRAQVGDGKLEIKIVNNSFK